MAKTNLKSAYIEYHCLVYFDEKEVEHCRDTLHPRTVFE